MQSEGIRSLPGLSFTYRGSLTKQDGLTFDGDDLTPIPLIDQAQATFAPYLLMSLPFTLRPDGAALILEPRGGLDVLLARLNGARAITAVEPNELALEAASAVYDDPRTRVIVDEPRAYVERTADHFDVIDLALTAPYRPVTSGAYSLAEDYRFTVEAFEQYLARLKPGGIFAALRWLQSPPSEETRLIALAAEAVRRSGADPARSIVALRGYSTALLLVKRGAFTPAELQAIRSFADARQFDLITAPDLQPGESNRYNVLPVDHYARLAQQLLTDPANVYDSYAFDVTPPTDDHPFFTHFFKWSQAPEVFATLGLTWQPFGGAGYFVLIVLLIFSAMAARGVDCGAVAASPPARAKPPCGILPKTKSEFSGEGRYRSPSPGLCCSNRGRGLGGEVMDPRLLRPAGHRLPARRDSADSDLHPAGGPPDDRVCGGAVRAADRLGIGESRFAARAVVE